MFVELFFMGGVSCLQRCSFGQLVDIYFVHMQPWNGLVADGKSWELRIMLFHAHLVVVLIWWKSVQSGYLVFWKCHAVELEDIVKYAFIFVAISGKLLSRIIHQMQDWNVEMRLRIMGWLKWCHYKTVEMWLWQGGVKHSALVQIISCILDWKH